MNDVHFITMENSFPHCLVKSCAITHTLLYLVFLQTDSLKCVAQASKNRSLADFEKVRSYQWCMQTLLVWNIERNLGDGNTIHPSSLLSCSLSPAGTNGVQSRAEGRPHHQHPSDQAVWQPAGAEPHQGHWTVLQGPGNPANVHIQTDWTLSGM